MDWVNDEKDLDSEDLPFVTNVPVIGLGSLKANEVQLSGKAAGLGSNTTYKVADGINPNEFAGQHVQVWIKDDAPSTIVWMEGSADEDVIMDRISDFYLDGKNLDGDASKLSKDSDIKNLKITLDGSGKTYKFSEDVKVTYNFHPYDALDALQDIISDNDGFTFSAKIVLNNKNEINYIHVIDDQTMNKSVKEVKYGSKMIEKIDADKKKIWNLDEKTFGDLEDLEEGEDFLVFLNNQPAKLSELQANDVYNVYYANGDEDKLLVFATRNVVEGKVSKVTMRNATDNRLVIDGKTYRFRLDHTTFSDDGNKKVEDVTEKNQDKIRDLDGEEVKLYLDASGRIRHIETADSVSDRKFKAVVTKGALYSGGDFNFEVISDKGKKVSITIDPKDIKDADGDQYPEDDVEEDFVPHKQNPLLLEVTLNAKGEADKVKVLDTVLYQAGPRPSDEPEWDGWDGVTWTEIADEDEEVIMHVKDGKKKAYEVTSDTAIFDLTSKIEGSKRPTLKKPGIAKFSKIADSAKTSVLYTLNEEDQEVDAIFVVGGTAASSDIHYGQILEYGRENSKYTMRVVTAVDKEVKEVEYTLDDKSSELTGKKIDRGDFIAFSLNGSDEVIVDEVVELVDKAHQIKNLKLQTNEDKLEAAEVYHITTAIASKIDGNQITYEVKDKDGKVTDKETYVTRTNTAYFNAYDLEPGSKVEEGDYIVLMSTSDVATRYDYVLFINSERQVKKENLDTRSFLEQADLEPGNDVEVPVTAPKVETVNDAEVVDGIVTLPADASVRDFEIAFDQVIDAKDATVTVTNEDTLGNVTVSEVATDAKVLTFKTAKLDTTKTYIITVKGLKDKNGKTVKDVTLYVEFAGA
ncbi:S-layer homology domain-containing protein, partial [Brevibacillus panacihumi]|uniref:S-layer homology domain-containing protein n=1 Tax=Brevibacillus panacihumi TaxID=497735 RepID=UPI003D25B457